MHTSTSIRRARGFWLTKLTSCSLCWQILATSLMESCLSVNDVAYVIDCGINEEVRTTHSTSSTSSSTVEILCVRTRTMCSYTLRLQYC